MANVSVRELKNKLSEHLRRLEHGESITVTRRGKPVGLLSPIPADETPEERLKRKLRDLAARGIITRVPEGKPRIPTRKQRIKLIGEGPTVSEMILEDRGEPIP